MLLLSTSAICFLSLSITVIYSLARTGQYLADLYRWDLINITHIELGD